MPIIRFHLEHQTRPAWPSEVVTHAECERHLRKLSRTACGCMRYGDAIRRPKTRIYMVSGLSTETNVARLFLTMSADRPLQGTDFATHQCDNFLCADPDHLLVGTHRSNVHDKFRRGRPIRERIAARWYDPELERIEAGPLATFAPKKIEEPRVYFRRHLPETRSPVCLDL